jgi:hypothetical protein
MRANHRTMSQKHKVDADQRKIVGGNALRARFPIYAPIPCASVAVGTGLAFVSRSLLLNGISTILIGVLRQEASSQQRRVPRHFRPFLRA